MNEPSFNEPKFCEAYERILVPSLFRPWAMDLLHHVRLMPEDRVLDVACGTGIVARVAREQLGADSQITGVDVRAFNSFPSARSRCGKCDGCSRSTAVLR